jgi:TetR/AcrR family transcriptional regulator
MPSAAAELGNTLVRPPRAATIRGASTAHIIATAAPVFAQFGLEGATMQALAAAAGLPKANLHYYFGTKEALYHAVLTDVLRQWVDVTADWFKPENDPVTALTGYIAAKLAHARARPESSRVFAGELLRGGSVLRPYLAGSLRERVESLADVIAAWQARGLMNPIDPRHLLFNIWAMTQNYADFSVQTAAVLGKPALDDVDFWFATETVTTLIINGTGARRGKEGS